MSSVGDATEAARATLRIRRFWGAQQLNFGRWFLSLPNKGQRLILAAANPDMPESAPAEGAPCKATDVLLPELTYDALLKDGGRGLNRLFEARANVRADREDVVMLMKLHARQQMPFFSQGSLDHLELAWVDPTDLQEQICGLPPSASEETKVSCERRRGTLHC